MSQSKGTVPFRKGRVVVGGSFAALVAADTLAGTGERVTLLLPERGVGGGFASIKRNGRALELGVRLLELSYEDDGGRAARVPPLRDYAPGIGGHRPYARAVSQWVHDLLGEQRLVDIGRPQMVLGDGVRADDVLFTVDLTRLPASLSARMRDRIAGEASGALRATGSDAGLLDPRYARTLAGMSVEGASLVNHGPTFHREVIAPLCDKVVDGGGARVLAPLRRKAWAALFHPRTLLDAMTGRTPAFRPARTFHTVGPDGAGAVVDELLARLRAAPDVELVTAGTLTAVAARGDDTELRFTGLDAPVVARRPILGTGAEELFGAAGIAYAPEKVRTAIAWLDVSVEEIEGDLPHLVHVLDRDNPVLRVSRGGGDGTGSDSRRAQLTVELRHDSDEDALHTTARDGLIAAGLLVKNAAPLPITGAARPTFAVPSAETRDAFRTARAAFDALQLDVELVGGGLDHAADSLNEQIVQGLRVAS